jgi:short-subunit dehydrogenase
MQPPFETASWLITGASSGIGRALAAEVAGRVGRLILVARREERLHALRNELKAKHPALTVDVLPADLLDRESTDAMLAEAGRVDVLVNNAGFGDMGVFDLADWDKTERMIALNVTALTYLTHRLVRGMVERGRGGILNISSGFGLEFMPGFAAYVGTKHYVSGFSESLRLELAGTGVAVTQVCPGPVATEFEDVAGNPLGRPPPKAVELSPEACAQAAIRGFQRGRALVVPGVAMRLVTWAGAVSPRWTKRLLYSPAARMLRRTQLDALEEERL